MFYCIQLRNRGLFEKAGIDLQWKDYPGGVAMLHNDQQLILDECIEFFLQALEP